MSDFILKYFLFLTGTFIFSFLSNKLFLSFSKTLGTRKGKNIIRWSSEEKPSLGGITFFIIFLFSFSLYPVLFESIDISNVYMAGILGASSLGFIMGLSDDAYNTKPLLKFFTQIACGVLLIYTGTYIRVFDHEILNYILTGFWVVGIMNSINMLDNMDGITAIVSIFILLTILISTILQEEFFSIYGILISAVIVSLASFLYFNWHPAKMFMGDTGSQFLGVILAAFSIKFLWNHDISSEVTSKQFLLPLIAFIVPIADTTTVFINRIGRGQSPFVGGKDHTTHHLSYLGFSDSQVALIIGFLSLTSASFCFVIMYFFKSWNHWFTLFFGVYALLVILSLFYITKITKQKN